MLFGFIPELASASGAERGQSGRVLFGLLPRSPNWRRRTFHPWM